MWSRRKGFWSWCKDFLACCKDFLCKPVFKKNLFNWDTVDKNKDKSEEDKLLSFLREDLTFLFRISSNFETHFKNTETSADLRKVFKDNKHSLSRNAEISTVDNENEWEIEDLGKVYKIKKSKVCKKLNIYGPGWTGDPDIRKTPEGKTIRIFEGENLPQIDLYEQEEKATLKIRDGRTIDLKVKEKDNELRIYYVEYPHSQVWRVLATIIVLILGLLLCIKSELIMTGESFDHLAICSLWLLILYLSLILWLPFRNIWECIERINYAKMEEEDLRKQVSACINVVSSLVAFSIAFIVLSLSIYFKETPFCGNYLTVFKLAMGLLVAGLIFLVVTLEYYGVMLNPAFNSAQIETIFTRGWWLYTIGLYAIVVGLLLYVYLLEPRITIIGVIIFIVAFTYYLRTPCNIIKKYQNWRIAK